jgi:protein phosphatase
MALYRRVSPPPPRSHNQNMNDKILQVASRTDPGRVRKFNEDSVGADIGAGVIALADGLGPQKGAEAASRIATTMVLEHLREPGTLAPRVKLREALGHADRAIRSEARTDPALKGMGSTLSVAWFHHGRVLFGHIGDSRIYRLRGGRLERMTSDHSFLNEQLSTGQFTTDELRRSQSRQLVTRALGVSEEVMPDLSEQEVEVGDLYLLCSDGLHDLVDDTDIAQALELLHPNLELLAETLVAMANDRGGRDNISVAVVRVAPGSVSAAEEPAAQSRGMFGWLRSMMGR